MLMFTEPIAQRARSHPDALAVLVDGGPSHTFAEYDRAIACMAAQLDVGAGDRVGVCAPVTFSCLVLIQALLRRGAVVVPVSTRLPDAARIALVEQLALRALFTTAMLDLLDMENAAPASFDEPDMEAPAIIVLTSGSSAEPKAVVHSMGSLLCNALGANQNMPLTVGDRWLLSLPVYHVSGLGILMRAALAGADVVIAADKPLDEAVRELSITHLSVVGSQLAGLAQAWERDGVPPSLKAVLAGGSSIPGGLVSRAHAIGVPLHLSYGSTEMGSQVTTTGAGADQMELKTSGTLLPYREATTAANCELLVRGQTLCKGYWQDGGVRPCVDIDGWFHTGDAGVFDDDGRLSVSGRLDRMFISGGENIFPEEIEEALMASAGVKRAAVVAVPDAVYGERPAAFIETQEDGPSEAEVKRLLADRLPKFKVPDAVWPWPGDYPQGGLKVDLPFLRRRAAEHMAKGR